MAQRDNLIYTALTAKTPEDRGQAIEALDGWDKARTEQDWAALITAEYGTGKAGRRALVQEHADVSPIGQRR